MGNPVKYYDPEGEAGELTLTWTSGAWWLVGADGPLPVGDLIFVGGVVVAVIIGGILVNVSKKYQKPPNPNRRKGAENRGPNPNAPGKNPFPVQFFSESRNSRKSDRADAAWLRRQQHRGFRT